MYENYYTAWHALLTGTKGHKEICPLSYIFCWTEITFSTGGVSTTIMSDSKVFENWPY